MIIKLILPWAKPVEVMVHSNLKVFKLNSVLLVDNGNTPISLRRLRAAPSKAGFIPATPLLLFISVLVLLELNKTE